jgi:hypothetical protein
MHREKTINDIYGDYYDRYHYDYLSLPKSLRPLPTPFTQKLQAAEKQLYINSVTPKLNTRSEKTEYEEYEKLMTYIHTNKGQKPFISRYDAMPYQVLVESESQRALSLNNLTAGGIPKGNKSNTNPMDFDLYYRTVKNSEAAAKADRDFAQQMRSLLSTGSTIESTRNDLKNYTQYGKKIMNKEGGWLKSSSTVSNLGRWVGRGISFLGPVITYYEGVQDARKAEKAVNIYTQRAYLLSSGSKKKNAVASALLTPIPFVPTIVGLLGPSDAKHASKGAIDTLGKTNIHHIHRSQTTRTEKWIEGKDLIIEAIKRDQLGSKQQDIYGLWRLEREHPGQIAYLISQNKELQDSDLITRAIKENQLKPAAVYKPQYIYSGYKAGKAGQNRKSPEKSKWNRTFWKVSNPWSRVMRWSIEKRVTTNKTSKISWWRRIIQKPVDKRTVQYTAKKAISWRRGFGVLAGFVNRYIKGRYTGGLVAGGSQLINVAEEGTPEMIIPLGIQRRDRGIELWERAGRMMNVDKNRLDRDAGKGQFRLPIPQQQMPDVMGIVNQNMNEVAEEVAGILNTQLSGQFANTPKL